MILFTLLSHQWKSFWRSRNAGKSLTLQILVGILVLYLLSMSVLAGFFLREFIVKNFPARDPAAVFCSAILYYFCIDILGRFNMQDLPTLSIQPYLVQNIRRSQLIRFLNIRSLFSLFNLVPLVLSLPFIVMQIGPEYGSGVALAFVTGIFSLTIFNHFLILYIKRKTVLNSWWIVGFFVVVALFGAGDYYKIFSLSHFSETLFTGWLVHPLFALIPVGMAMAAYGNNYRFLYNNLYLEDIVRKSRRREGTEYAFLNRFGDIGELVALDLKLMLRNKRPRTVLMMSFIFLLYGFIFYKPGMIRADKMNVVVFGAIFMIGILIVQYGQFLFAWQSSHFDGLMAGRLSVRTYIKSKFVLFTISCTINLLLSSFYGILSWKIIPIQIAAYFYNIGIHTVMAVYFATYSYKGIDISRRAAFNYQGLGAAQWLYAIFIFLIPMILYIIFDLIGGVWVAVTALGVLGLISLLLREWWIGLLTKQFLKRKYLILEGFREK